MLAHSKDGELSNMADRVNCWEFKNCGRQEGGKHVHDLGVCPASVDNRLDGAHGGTNAGRACWVLVGTLCKGVVQGSFAQKIDNCLECDFYKKVKREEDTRFELTATLLGRIRAAS